MTSVLNGPHGPPLNEGEAAKALGVSRPTFKKAVASGIVPGGFQVGRLRLYPRPAIWALLTGLSPSIRGGETS
jgi:hypothetical protein